MEDSPTDVIPTGRHLRRLLPPLLVSLALVILLGGTAPAAATEGGDENDGDPTAPATEDGEEVVDPEQAARDELLREGSTVYTQICSSCHQPGGAGLGDQFPPLLDNPNVDDADYVADVIANGRQGPITVGGVTYDGVMPAFSTLSDDEVTAVIAYIQNDFQAPQAAIDAFEAVGPVAGTELPLLSSYSSIVAFALALSVAGMVLAPRLVSVNDRLETPWLDAWLKTGVIVSSIIFLTVVVPDWAVKTSAVGDLGRLGQDIVGGGLWLLGFVAVAGGLWYAHRESRI